MPKFVVVLFNLGGPDSLDSVQPFLENLFNDPDIFKMPFQKYLAKFISKKRAPKVQKEYELIGGKSPIAYWTEIQRKMLEEKFQKENLYFDVFTAMRYWNPSIKDIAKKIQSINYEKIFLLPLYPHFSISTTGSSFNEWNRNFAGDFLKIILVNDYFDNEKYIKAINLRLDEALQKFSNKKDVTFVFSAHGTPISFVKKGDPYSIQIKKTIELVMKQRNFSHNYVECFQSKVGPVKWLEPSTEQMIVRLSLENKKNLLIIPISFVSDHIETLYELNIQYKNIAVKNGIENFVVMEGLNNSELFIEALFDEIKERLI